MKRVIFPVLAAFAIASCGNDSVDKSASEATLSNAAPEVASKPGAAGGHTAKSQGPVSIDYRIIGTPIVGQPVGIELQVITLVESPAITLSYRVNDTTAMQLTEAQPASVSLVARKDDAPSQQQVQVIPLREGRIYLNVSATVEGEDGSLSTVIAIPIQVGVVPREIQDNGEVTLDENGELIRSLPATEN
jgi:hypothetical protein